jgi:integrase
MNGQVKAMLVRLRKGSSSEYVFPSPRRDGCRITDIKKGFNAAIKEAEISDFHFHDLRHYAEFRTMPSRSWQATRVARESWCSLLSAVSATRHSFRVL